MSTTKNPYAGAEYEGWPVVGASASVGNVGQALTKALSVDPARWELGDTVMLVVRADVVNNDYPAVPGEESSRLRHHALRATDVTVLPKEIQAEAVKAINEQLDRITAAEEARQGISRLPGV